MTSLLLTEDYALFRPSPAELLDPKRLVRRMRRALRAAGLPPWPFAEAALHPAGSDTLLWLRRIRRLYIALPDFETVLTLLPLCPGPAALYARLEDYLLALDSSAAPPGLWDWGRPRPLRAEEEARWREQGLCLRADARELLPLFSRPNTTE